MTPTKTNSKSSSTKRRRGASSSRPALLTDVLCGVDGTRTAYEAVRQAAVLAGADGQLTLLAVTGATGSGRQQAASFAPARARRALDHARRLASQAGVTATLELDEGGPVMHEVLERATAHQILALGAPSMTRLAHLLFGGTATIAAHTLPSSLLVARRPPANIAFGQRIIVASDALEHSDKLVDYAVSLARARGTSLTLLHAAGAESAHHPTRLGEQVRRVTEALGVEARIRIEPGRAHEMLAGTATQERASLVIVSSRHLGGLRALGSVSERAVHDAPCSVLVVRPEDL